LVIQNKYEKRVILTETGVSTQACSHTQEVAFKDRENSFYAGNTSAEPVTYYRLLSAFAAKGAWFAAHMIIFG